MPIFEYICEQCGETLETIQKFGDPPPPECPKCGGKLRKKLSAPAFQFKGSGWYVTDYARKGDKGGDKSESSGKSSGSSGSSESSSGGGSSSGGDDSSAGPVKKVEKSEPKSDSKSESKSESSKPSKSSSD